MCNFKIKQLPEIPNWDEYNNINITDEKYTDVLKRDTSICKNIFLENAKNYIAFARSLEYDLRDGKIKSKRELNIKFDFTAKTYNELKEQFDEFMNKYKNKKDINNYIKDAKMAVIRLSDLYQLGFVNVDNNKLSARRLIDKINENLTTSANGFYGVGDDFFDKI